MRELLFGLLGFLAGFIALFLFIVSEDRTYSDGIHVTVCRYEMHAARTSADTLHVMRKFDCPLPVPPVPSPKPE